MHSFTYRLLPCCTRARARALACPVLFRVRSRVHVSRVSAYVYECLSVATLPLPLLPAYAHVKTVSAPAHMVMERAVWVPSGIAQPSARWNPDVDTWMMVI